MDIYKILKYALRIKSTRLRLIGVWGMYFLKRRHYGIYIDPILGCNYRCQMCYFSNDEVRRNLHGRLSFEKIEAISKAFFPKAMKLQIGCGAEPSLAFDETLTLVRLGKEKQIPYISITSNGALLSFDKLKMLIEAGLNELTISMHGVVRDTYEKFMRGKYDCFLSFLQNIRDLQKSYPDFRLRVNYVMNADNTIELKNFLDVFKDIKINVLQLRPVQKIGDSEYNNFDLKPVADCMESIILPLCKTCRERGTIVIAPEHENFELAQNKQTEKVLNQLFTNFTYCYISPKLCYRDDFSIETDTYDSYSRRTHVGWKMICAIFTRNRTVGEQCSHSTKSLNYQVQG